MTGTRSRDLSSRLPRYAVALIVSIVLPMGGLVAYMLEAERQEKAAHAELTFYHQRTETLAISAHESLGRIWQAVNTRDGEIDEVKFSRRMADARFEIQSAVDEIQSIEGIYGSERCSAIVERIETEWGRIVEGLDDRSFDIPPRNAFGSLDVALLQLERVHEIESDVILANMRSEGWLSFPGLAIVGGCVVLVSGGLAGRIYLRMRKMVGEIGEGTEALSESEERFRQLSENVEAVFWITLVDVKTVIFVSRGFEKLWGRTLESLNGNPDIRIEGIHVEDRERVLAGLLTIGEGASWIDEYRIVWPDGSVRWIRDRGFPVRDGKGKVVRLAGVAADITEEKLAREGILLSEGHLRSLMESAEGFIVMRVQKDSSLPSGGKIIFVSPIVREIMGVSDPSDYASCVNHIHDDDSAWVLAASRRLVGDSVPFNEEFRYLHPVREEWRWLRAIVTPVQDQKSGDLFFNGIVIDITEEKRAKEELEKAVEEIRLMKDLAVAENVYLREEMLQSHFHGEIIGKSEALNAVMLQAEQVAKTDSSVLLLGETGTGKEVVARAIHRLSERSEAPLIVVNCAAIPENLVESELFGREKGAYTGATTSQKGRFELADGGTIFLDEVGELPGATQAKLLRVLQEGYIERLGSTETIQVDVRVIAATNRNLAQRVSEGEFREDLYYRLSVFPIEIPPLRERREDVAVLARHFVKEFAAKMGKEVEKIERGTLRALEEYSWPGNVRELRNVIERGMILATGKTLRAEILREAGDGEISPRGKPLAEVERDHILATLEAAGWKVRGDQGAAAILGLAASTLESRMKKLGVERPEKA